MAALVLAGLLTFGSIAVPDAGSAPATAATVIRDLVEEARTVVNGERAARTRADFARTVGDSNLPELKRDLTRRLKKPIDRDAWIDAYVRWQLTGFDLDLPVDPENARAFGRWLETLPPLPNDPRSDEAERRRLLPANGRGLSETDQASFRIMLDDLSRRVSEARAKSRPAVEFRRWIARKLPDHGLPALSVRLESCRALVRSGWEPGDAIREVDACCERTAKSPGTDDALLAAFDREANLLTETTSMAIRTARIDDDIARVEVELVAVRDYDITRWRRKLRLGKID